MTNGDNSLQGDASLELAVLEPPPPPGECMLCEDAKSSEGIIKDRPEVEALFTTDLDLCLLGNCTRPNGECSRFSDDDVPVSKLLCSSSTEIENFGKMSRVWAVLRLLWICGDTSSLSVCEDSGVLIDLLKSNEIYTETYIVKETN